MAVGKSSHREAGLVLFLSDAVSGLFKCKNGSFLIRDFPFQSELKRYFILRLAPWSARTLVVTAIG